MKDSMQWLVHAMQKRDRSEEEQELMQSCRMYTAMDKSIMPIVTNRYVAPVRDRIEKLFLNELGSLQ